MEEVIELLEDVIALLEEITPIHKKLVAIDLVKLQSYSVRFEELEGKVRIIETDMEEFWKKQKNGKEVKETAGIKWKFIGIEGQNIVFKCGDDIKNVKREAVEALIKKDFSKIVYREATNGIDIKLEEFISASGELKKALFGESDTPTKKTEADSDATLILTALQNTKNKEMEDKKLREHVGLTEKEYLDARSFLEHLKKIKVIGREGKTIVKLQPEDD